MDNNLYDLVQKAQKNNDDLYSIVEQFYPTIKKFANRLNYEEAETDLIIFSIILLRKINLNNFNLKGDGVLINYIHSAIKNKFIDIYRKNIKNRNVCNEDIELLIDIVIDETSYKFDERIVTKMLVFELPYIEREVIIARYYDRLTDSETIERLKISRQSIYNIRERALKKLRAKLKINL